MHLVHKVLKSNCEITIEIKEGSWNIERKRWVINQRISKIEK
jgi:hypothetical protein